MIPFALVTAVTALAGALLLSRLYGAPRATHAIWTSAALALAVQIATFGVARRYASRGEVMKGWGLGALIRGAVLVFYGLVLLGPWQTGIPLEPALLSFALLVFVSTVMEPLFLSS